MSLFENANRVKVTGLTVTQIQAAAGSSVTVNNQSSQMGDSGIGLEKLSAGAAHSAMHDSSARFPAPRCYQNTRTTYLDALERWLLAVGGEYDSKRFIWLTGGAGAGKSAIMQSIVERCAIHAVILGTFFFSRTDSSRNYAEVLIPTLAYQLACNFPAVMDILEPCMQRRPGILKASLLTQANELLVRPLLYLAETGTFDNSSPLRRVFVIDGLDECQDAEKQAHVIHVVATILCHHNVPISFLIASRPETAIRRAFESQKMKHPIFSSLTLDDDAEATADIRQFIEDSFLDILESHPLRAHIPSNWPHPRDVARLVRKSSGHFIYAATVMKFISSSDEHPARALRVVEGLVPSRMENPFAELDALYLHILTAAKYSREVLEILRFCSFSLLEKSVSVICFMYPHISPQDVELFLSDVQALVSLSRNNNGEIHISLKHASLSDFFSDPDRSHLVYTSPRGHLASLLPRYFSCLDDDCQLLFSLPGNSSYYIIFELNYAINYSQDIGLLQSLVDVYPLQRVRIFCQRHCGARCSMGVPDLTGMPIALLSQYMCAIRESGANHDNALYSRLFKTFIQILIEDINSLARADPQYQIIPALIFSSTSSSLTSVAHDLILCFPQNISPLYSNVFKELRAMNVNETICQTDPRSYEAIRDLSQAQSSWASDLADGLTHVLQHLMTFTCTPECLRPTCHKQWLNKMKPFKHLSQGSPKLSSAFYSYLQALPTPKPDDDYNHMIHICVTAFQRHGWSKEDAQEICWRREKCYVYLQAIIHYLHKCDSTGTLAKLARRSLPKTALWFPRLMKRARKVMDAYVRHWEESLDGLLERAQLFTINEMD